VPVTRAAVFLGRTGAEIRGESPSLGNITRWRGRRDFCGFLSLRSWRPWREAGLFISHAEDAKICSSSTRDVGSCLWMARHARKWPNDRTGHAEQATQDNLRLPGKPKTQTGVGSSERRLHSTLLILRIHPQTTQTTRKESASFCVFCGQHSCKTKSRPTAVSPAAACRTKRRRKPPPVHNP
jgi:hypothetical protein